MVNNNLQKILKVLLIVIMTISVIILGIFINAIANLPDGLETEFDKQIEIYGSKLDMIMYWAYILLAIVTFIALIFPVIRLITRPKEAIKTVISIVVIIVFVYIAYLLSDDTILKLPGYDGHDNVKGTLIFADTVIFTMYFLMGAAILSIVYAEISKVLK